MAIEIINYGGSLKIVTDESLRLLLKNQIREVEVVRDNILKIDIGQGALYNVFIDQSEVTSPVTESVEELRDIIIDMIQPASSEGMATERTQSEGNQKMDALKHTVEELSGKVGSLGEKFFYEPKLVDETNANAVYKGYAVPGAKPSEAVWAVLKITNSKGVLSYHWAGGNKNFDKVWDNRKVLTYS